MQNRSMGSRMKRGFTLIEILVVVVILAVLAAVIVPNVLGRVDDSKNSVAITTVQSLTVSNLTASIRANIPTSWTL